jgi:TfoX/Sxy family transcriptional regulator of competence genes
MAYDEDLADRVREVVAREEGLTEQRMFGGLAFLLNGRMAVAASSQGGLLLRCDPADTDELLRAPGVGRFVMNHREMDGWLRVEPSAIATDEALRGWVAHGVRYASSLPPK